MSRRTKVISPAASAVSPPAEAPEAGLTVGNADLLVAGTDAEFRDFVADLFAAASGMQSVRRALGKATSLTGSEIAMLLAIRRLSAAGSVSVRAIAEHLHVAGAHATTEVGKLAEQGLVTKHADARDSRAVDVKLTPEGRQRLRSLTPKVRRVNDVLFDGMTAEEMRHVHRFLRRLIAQSALSVERLEAGERGARGAK